MSKIHVQRIVLLNNVQLIPGTQSPSEESVSF